MFTCGQYCSLPGVYMCWNVGHPLWFWVWKPYQSIVSRAICVWFCTWNFIFLLSIYMHHKQPRLREVLVLCLYPQTLSPTMFHRNQKLLDILPLAHWGECRKQLEKQIVAGRLSPGPLTLTHDWTFTWMDKALPFWKTPRMTCFP